MFVTLRYTCTVLPGGWSGQLELLVPVLVPVRVQVPESMPVLVPVLVQVPELVPVLVPAVAVPAVAAGGH